MLRTGGCLTVEEEFPITKACSPTQEVWAEKWRILKAATILTGVLPYTEFAPATLADLCRLAGFDEIEWTAEMHLLQGGGALDFFQRRLDRLLPQLPNDRLRAGFAERAADHRATASRIGGMEIPFYRLTARAAPSGD